MRAARWLILMLLYGVLFAAAAGISSSAGGCGPTCMETEDWYGDRGESSSGACGPHPTPLTTGTSGP